MVFSHRRYGYPLNQFCAFVLLALIASSAEAFERRDTPDVFVAEDVYTKTAYRVPMRDGVELFTLVYAPIDQAQSYPILLYRTPYSIKPYETTYFHNPIGPSVEFDASGYIFIYQDVRGKFRSEGEFEVMRPLRDTPDGVDETTDTYDTIAWALDTIPNHNGRVGQWGISYSAWQTVMGIIEPHPALVAASPQASPADMFIGDDWHHNGAFRLMYAFAWLSNNARTRDGIGSARPEAFDYGTPWGYKFFLDVGPIRRIDDLFFHGQVPAWTDFMTHGTYDAYWQRQNVLTMLQPTDIAVLNVAGWFDAEDFYGPMEIYKTLEALRTENASALVVGPWRHGGWRRDSGSSLGAIDFGTPTSEYFQEAIQFPFFEHHLKGVEGWEGDEAIVFETGANAWRRFDAWPPSETRPVDLYLREDKRLAFEAPVSDGSDAYLSDPDKPVPFSAEIRTTQGHEWMIEDQRFAATRPDVLVYETEPLADDLTIAGPILAELFVSSTGTDADYVVKLIDVFPGDAPDPHPNPDGVRMGDFQMLLAGEVFRAKFRDSYSTPTPLTPGEVTPITIDLRDRFHSFKAGHRIMVQVQSSWFPVIDRNPQQFTDIYTAGEEAFVEATQTVHRAPGAASRIRLRVLEESAIQP